MLLGLVPGAPGSWEVCQGVWAWVLGLSLASFGSGVRDQRVSRRCFEGGAESGVVVPPGFALAG